MTRCRPRCTRRGVTLLEVVLAMGILVFLSSMTYWFYSSSLETSRDGTAAAQRLRLVRVILDRMAKEIRQAAVITVDDQVGIRGEAERIWLTAYRVPTRVQSQQRLTREEPPPPEYDLTKIEYKIVRHPEIMHEDNYEWPLGLARIEGLIPRPQARLAEDENLEDDEFPFEEGEEEEDSTGEEETGTEEEEDALEDTLDNALGRDRVGEDEEDIGDASLALDIRWDELYAVEVRYLRFCYYDGHRWWDSWDISGENPLPQLVRVTIGFEAMPPFGEAFGPDDPNEEFCECLNEDPVDCRPLPLDQYSITVRVAQADPLFRSRVSRETQAFMEDLSGEGEVDGEVEE
ncbi:MAG: hypothetical protein ABH877_03440 [bacterium]